MILLNLTVKCSSYTCDETIDIQIDWDDVSIDLNDKKVCLPVHSELYSKDWTINSQYRSYRGTEREDWHHCPKCTKDIKG